MIRNMFGYYVINRNFSENHENNTDTRQWGEENNKPQANSKKRISLLTICRFDRFGTLQIPIVCMFCRKREPLGVEVVFVLEVFFVLENYSILGALTKYHSMKGAGCVLLHGGDHPAGNPPLPPVGHAIRQCTDCNHASCHMLRPPTPKERQNISTHSVTDDFRLPITKNPFIPAPVCGYP